MKIKCIFLKFSFTTLNSNLNIKKFKFKVFSAKNFHKWRSKSFEIATQCSKILSLPTLNANILQSMWSNFMKFLPHDQRQVKYKILFLDSKKNVFFFLDEYLRYGSFEWFLSEKMPWSLRG